MFVWFMPCITLRSFVFGHDQVAPTSMMYSVFLFELLGVFLSMLWIVNDYGPYMHFLLKICIF